MKRSLKFSFFLAFLSPFAWGDQNSTLIDTVIPSDAINAGHFGAALSVWGDLSVVGAHNAGSVYVYREEHNGSMTKIAKLTAPDGGSNTQFGYSVSMDDGILAVGAKWSDQDGLSNLGAAYLYQIEQNGSVQYLQKLVPSDANVFHSDNFGYSVSVSDHFVAIGSPYHDHGGIGNAGSSYLYRVEQNGTVSHLSNFTASDANASDKFGSSVSLSGNLLAVGSYDDDHAGGVDAGSAYLFQLEQNGSVTELGKVTASDASANDEFGRSVSLFGDTFAVGAEGHDPNGLNSAGAAYLFRLEQNGSISFLDKVKDGPAGAKLGFSLSLDEDLLAVGANQETLGGKSDAGAVYLYRVEQNGSANLLDRIVAQDANASDEFGSAVSLSDGVLAIGAPSTDYWGNTDAGTVFFYDVDPVANRAPVDIRPDPFLGFSAEKEELIHNLQNGWLKSAEQLVFDAYGWTVDSTDDWNVTVHEEHSSLKWGRSNFSYAGPLANAVSIELVLSDLLSLSDLRLARGEVTKRVAQVLLAQNSYYGDITGDGVSGGWWFKSGLARFLVGMDHGVLSLLGTEPTDAEIDALLAAVGDGETIQTEQQIAAAYLAVRYLDYKLRQIGFSQGIGQMTNAMKTHLDSGGGTGSGINGYFSAMHDAGYFSFANPQAFLTDFKGVNGRNFILTQVLPTIENNDTGSVLGSDVAGGPALNALSVIPDLQGAPQSNVLYEIDEGAAVLEFDEDEPVGTVVGKFNAVDPDDPQLGWKGYDLIDHGANISWADAKAAADAADAADPFHWVYLATVTSEAEHNLTAHLVAQAGVDAWLGASDAAVEGEWRWTAGPEGQEAGGQGLQFWQGDVNGTSVNGLFTNWLSSDPNPTYSSQADWLSYNKNNMQWDDKVATNGNVRSYLLEADQVLTHVYSLVSGYGDDHNHLFSLEPDGTLRTAAAFDYETHSNSYSVRVRVTDELNASFEKPFWVDLLDVDEDPDKDGLPNDVDLDDDGDGYPDTEEIAANSDPRNGWSLPPVTKVIYVDEDAEGENNGSSWTHAYDNLQAALAEADGVDRTQIWLAEGVYRPDVGPGRTAGDRTASFQLKNRLEIIGGFQGHEQNVDERGSHGFITYLSGDIGGQNWPGDNSYHVVNASGVDRTAVLSDLGVVDGQADGPGQWDKRGAGILADNGSPSLRFIGFFNNHAAGTSNGGGALCVYNGGSPTVFSALFQSNSAEWGGAVKLSMGSSAVFYNTLFLGNQADNGGALVLWESNASITHSTLTENNATNGGALYAGSNSILAFHNSIAWGNQAAQQPSRFLSQSNLVAVHSVIEGGHGDLSDAEPLFADPLHNDFRLRAGSPFVDAGDPAKVGALSIDYHGISRSQDAAPDLGLFEGGADVVDLGGTIGYSGVVDSGPFRVWLMDQSGFRVKETEMPNAGPYSFVVERGHSYKVKAFRDANADGWPNQSDPWAYHHHSPIQINASRNDFDVHLEDAVVESNATVSGTIQYLGPVPGPVIVWVINDQGHYVREVVLPNGPGPYSVTLPKGAAYDLMAFRDGNGNGLLDVQKEVGEPFAHHGDWNSSTQSHDLIFVDGNRSGVDIEINFHGDHDQDGITDWEEYVAGGGYVSPQEHVLDQGLIRFYRLDGNASDEFDHQNNGVSHGTEPGPNRFGEKGMALFFDGEDDYVELPSLELGSSYSLSVWVLPAEEKGGGYFNVLSNNGDPVWGVREGNLQQYLFGRVEGSAVQRHAWTHLVLVRDGDFHNLYKNGQLDASAEVPADNDVFSVIGAYLPTAEALDDREPFHGSIDDLLVWERALTHSEVSLLNKFESERPEEGEEEAHPPASHDEHDGHHSGPHEEESLVPIVWTGLHRVGPEGEYEIEALILTEGSSPVLEVGVFLSRSVRGEYPRWVPAQLNEDSLWFTVSVADLEPGARYYYRAYARNAAGDNIGSLRKLVVTREEVPPGAWWSDMPKAEGGWRSSEWFGEFRMFGQTEWIFHSELGWVFVVPAEERGLWLWHRELGWLWTQEGTWPHLWRNDVFDWLYFLRNHEGRAVLYDYRSSDYLILP